MNFKIKFDNFLFKVGVLLLLQPFKLSFSTFKTVILALKLSFSLLKYLFHVKMVVFIFQIHDLILNLSIQHKI